MVGCAGGWRCAAFPSVDHVREEAGAGDLGAHDQDEAAVGADAQVASFHEIEVLGGAGVVGVVDVGIAEEESVGGDLEEGADVDQRALGVQDDNLVEEGGEGVGVGRMMAQRNGAGRVW